jgi:ubiquinol-cytochrome c reductase cytochrome c1 subunit
MKRPMRGFLRAWILLLGGLLVTGTVAAQHVELMPFEPDTGNLASAQRGAGNFMNYCSGCHGMKHLRYNRLAKDLQIPEDLLKKHLMFTTDKVGDHILSAIPSAEAAQWFGQSPPDLTVTTRQRGPDWVYTYLLSFYLDPTRPTGVNNPVLPGASMPHVLWELQGWQQLVTEEHKAEGAESEGHGEGHGGHGPKLELVQPGSLKPEEYKKWVADLVNFMAYAAEPGKQARQALGVKVILYLLVLLVLSYLLKKEFWKDVH